MAKNPYRGMKKTAKANYAMARAMTGGEFSWTQDALSTIYGNLGTTMAGGRAQLTKEQRRLMGAVAAGVTDQRRKSTRITNQAKGNISRLYGSAALGSTSGGHGKGGTMDTVTQTARSGAQDIKGKLAAGSALGRGNLAAYTTLQQGTELARAGADAQLADALSYRAKNDATLYADQMFEIEKMKVQNRLDIQNYKAKLALEDEAAGGSSSSAQVASSAADAGQALFGYMGMVQADGSKPVGEISSDGKGGWVDEEGNAIAPMNARQAADTYIANYGVTDENEAAVIYSISRALYTAGAGQAPEAFTGTPQSIAAAVQERLSFLYPDMSKKQRANIQGLLTASFADLGPTGPATGGVDPDGGDRDESSTFDPGSVDANKKTVSYDSLVDRARDMGVPVEQLIQDLESRGWRVVR